MYVLMLDGHPEKVSEEFECLSEAMAGYTGAQQARMTIVADVEFLR